MASGYGDKVYWDQRYEQQSDQYDWYLPYEQFKEALLPFMNVKLKNEEIDTVRMGMENTTTTPTNLETMNENGNATTTISTNPNNVPLLKTAVEPFRLNPPRSRKDVKILIVGCGNSELSSAMYEDGFTQILSIDYSPIVIEKMRAAHAHYSDLRYEMMDVRSMNIEDEEYDFIIDKGTLDAILCGEESSHNSTQMLEECFRVLAPNGVFFLITYGQPMMRLPYLERVRYDWSVDTEMVGQTRYMYIMKKNGKPEATSITADGSENNSATRNETDS